MKIELKNIKLLPSKKSGNQNFSALLFINGTRAADVENRGEFTQYMILPYKKQIIKKAEDYCLVLPPLKHEFGGEIFSLTMDLECYIDELFNEWNKNRKKGKKDVG